MKFKKYIILGINTATLHYFLYWKWRSGGARPAAEARSYLRLPIRPSGNPGRLIRRENRKVFIREGSNRSVKCHLTTQIITIFSSLLPTDFILYCVVVELFRECFTRLNLWEEAESFTYVGLPTHIHCSLRRLPISSFGLKIYAFYGELQFYSSTSTM